MSDPAESDPARTADAPSPPADSSALVGSPSRRSAATTRVGVGACSAVLSATTPDRIAPPKSAVTTSVSSRSAAWMVVAFVLSR